VKIRRIPKRKTRIAMLSKNDLDDLLCAVRAALDSTPEPPEVFEPQHALVRARRAAWFRIGSALVRAGARAR